MKIIFKKSGKGILLILISSLIILPFGNVLAYGTNYQYTGQENDPNSNLYYYGQRYYQPEVGRFTQPDPVSKYLNDPQKLNKATGQDLQGLLENPQALNEYGYTQNNPIRYTDPTGEYIDEVFDPMFISQSYENMQSKQTTWSQIAFGADLALLVVPFAPTVMFKTGDLFEGLYKSVKNLFQSSSKIGELKLRGSYLASYEEKLKATFSWFKNKGFEVQEHGLNNIIGREVRGINKDAVLEALNKGEKYFDPVNNTNVLRYNNINIYLDVVDPSKIISIDEAVKVKSRFVSGWKE